MTIFLIISHPLSCSVYRLDMLTILLISKLTVVLRPCYTVKKVSRYLYYATFCIMILVSLHTKSSSMFHAEFGYKLFPPKWRILTMKTLSYKLRRLSICSFDQRTSLLFSPFPVMFYLPCADHVLLFVDDVVASWPQTKISDWSDIKCIVILAVQNR